MVAINNRCVCYEINEENKSEEFKRNDLKFFDVDNFYSVYHLELILKDRREKL